jgi:transposase
MNEIMDTTLRVKRRHRLWPESLKREIVAASLVAGASVSEVARHYDVNANLVFAWRKLFDAAPAVGMPQLMPVVVTPDPPALAQRSPATNVIEIELPRGYRVRVGSNIKAAALRIVLDALERR